MENIEEIELDKKNKRTSYSSLQGDISIDTSFLVNTDSISGDLETSSSTVVSSKPSHYRKHQYSYSTSDLSNFDSSLAVITSEFIPFAEAEITLKKYTTQKPSRKYSLYDKKPGTNYIVDVAHIKHLLLSQEDIDNDSKITIEDKGPKTLKLGSLNSGGIFKKEIRGNYSISTLLQELSLAEEQKYKRIILNENILNEDPIQRLKRLIQWWFYPALLRRLDINGIENALKDDKFANLQKEMKTNYIYVPYDDPIAFFYYSKVSEMKPDLKLKVIRLPNKITADYIHNIRKKPGILSLGLRMKNATSPMSENVSQSILAPPASLYSFKFYSTISTSNVNIVSEYEGLPFVVPGGRFNEMYGWDSYFITRGLLLAETNEYSPPSCPTLVDSIFSKWPSHLEHPHLRHYTYTKCSLKYDPLDVSKSMVDNLIYEIQHYGKILNANRSYYLGRSQPPFLTDMIIKVYEKLKSNSSFSSFNSKDDTNESLELNVWLADALRAAIKEYFTVWMTEPRFVSGIGLCRYHPEGMGIPTETEESHFDAVILPYAQKHGLTVKEFIEHYQEARINEPQLDEYFLHDRAVRESGHDTSYRFDGNCAHLCTVDLNSLLYKYEIDIGTLLSRHFPNGLSESIGSESYVPKPEFWFEASKKRKALFDKYCWDDEKQSYYDYDIKDQTRRDYDSATIFWTLWSGIAGEKQAALLVEYQLKKFEMPGGLVCGTEASRGPISISRPSRQWDYPYGWPPHQMLAWEGLGKYGYAHVSRRLAYRWLYMMTKAFVDYNGVVPEKFDVVKSSHKISVEYGNVGVDFKFVPREGFGWMNASYQYGLTWLTESDKKALGALIHPDHVFKN